MKVTIEGKNIELTDAIKDHVNDKLERLSKHYEQIIKGHEVKVKLSVEKNPRISKSNKAEVTIFLDGRIIRSEEMSVDMYNSIDTVAHKLDRQIKKYKTKVYRSYQHKERPHVNPKSEGMLLDSDDESAEKEAKIIKTKKFQLHPMTAEEAIEHLDLIGHDFYMFINADTKVINTVYLRKDGEYGHIEPK